MKKMKKILFSFLLILPLLMLLPHMALAETSPAEPNKSILIFDTDAGTDDAVAMLLLKYLGIDPDYIVATGGNASADGAVRNCFILRKSLGISSPVVRGFEIKLSEESSTFHGEDGLANISAEMIAETGLTEEELHSEVPLEDFKKELLQYDTITYIAVGPLSTLKILLEDEQINPKLTQLLVMGGGINEFNCSHDTEFNFSKNPEAVKAVLSSGKDIVLFPLDLTNHQRVTEEQTAELEKFGNLPHFITFLKFNHSANMKYDNIDAAVMHDSMPVLYWFDSEPFTVEDTRISVDEYGHIEKSETGYPLKVVTAVQNDLLFNTLTAAFYG